MPLAALPCRLSHPENMTQSESFLPVPPPLQVRWPRATSAPPLSDELARWMSEAQWAAVVSLAQLPAFSGLAKDLEKSCDDWERWAGSEAPERMQMPGGLGGQR